MNRVIRTNLGNWLVLEKWMMPELFDGAGAEDEVWLARKLPPDTYAEKIRRHRDTYVTEADFRFIAEHGFNCVRIPVPYFFFGDRPPFIGCVEYLDKAFDRAEAYGLRILIDLHTVPWSQNGYDNGGITGVCKWHKHPEEVEFALTVLERLAESYGTRPGLYGIEVLNEPISWIVYRTAPSTGKAVDRTEAKGSGYVPLAFLKQFYRDAYRRLRVYLPREKTIVFHDGFRLTSWKKFFRQNGFENVALDTHIYIFAMESFVPFAKPWVYQIYIGICKRQIRSVQKAVPVIVGEWCLCNKYASRMDAQDGTQLSGFRRIAGLEIMVWQETAGWFYWNYQLLRDRKAPMDQSWKESWDLCRCLEHGWLSREDIRAASNEPSLTSEGV